VRYSTDHCWTCRIDQLENGDGLDDDDDVWAIVIAIMNFPISGGTNVMMMLLVVVVVRSFNVAKMNVGVSLFFFLVSLIKALGLREWRPRNLFGHRAAVAV
jgi:hypothetical protein